MKTSIWSTVQVFNGCVFSFYLVKEYKFIPCRGVWTEERQCAGKDV